MEPHAQQPLSSGSLLIEPLIRSVLYKPAEAELISREPG